MKKIIAVFTCALMLFAFGCAKQPAAEAPSTEVAGKEETTGEEATGSIELPELPIVGGWTVDPVGSDALPEEAATAFSAVTENLLGVNYTPIAFLGSQVVAGTNYAILCKAEPVVQDPETSLKVMILYVDLEGKAELLEIGDFELGEYAEKEDAGAPQELLSGGWQAPETAATGANLPEDAVAAFNKALEGFTGNDLEPVAYLGSQVVAGTNYAFLCHSTLVTLDPITSMQLVTVYADLEGNATVTNIVTVDPADFN